MTTKERILYESMKLFSVNGFESVSIRTIADEVGVTNSALYKHFKSKQEIFDAIVEQSKERYLKQCTDAVNAEIRGIDQMKEVCINMYRYQTHDNQIVMFRRILMIEQFKNSKMADIYKEFFIDIPMLHQQKIFEELIRQGLMKNRNPKVLSMELYAPFHMYHAVKHDEAELVQLFEQHAEYFFENNIIHTGRKRKWKIIRL